MDHKLTPTEQVMFFARWLGERKYTKHQVNDRWYDPDFDYQYMGSTKELHSIFIEDVGWIRDEKTRIMLMKP